MIFSEKRPFLGQGCNPPFMLSNLGLRSGLCRRALFASGAAHLACLARHGVVSIEGRDARAAVFRHHSSRPRSFPAGRRCVGWRVAAREGWCGLGWPEEYKGRFLVQS